ncbi:MAG: hypothetical protein K0S98_2325, partial [Propionibacteriaceae bacterium]|nr:hypothetical protein [Propionibacteriaceae bacterium]
DWVEQDPRLATAPAVDGLRDWLMLVGIDAADEVLHALIQIGSPSGRDCRPAAWVVAWALLPGRDRGGPTGAGGSGDGCAGRQPALAGDPAVPLVAAPKGRRHVLANLRSAIAREGALKRPSWAERRTVPTDRLPEQQLHEQVSPSEELSDVLSWGEQVGLIGSGDRLLLCSLVEHTDRLAVRTVCRGGQGLKSRQGAQIAHPGPNCGSMLRADAVRHLPLQWLPRAIHRGIECLRVSLRATLIHAVTPIHLFP